MYALNLHVKKHKILSPSFSNIVGESAFASENTTEVVFAVGAGEGNAQCLDIAITNDDLAEGLECFSFSFSIGFNTGIFVPVCIEDNDSKAFHCLDNHALIEVIAIFFQLHLFLLLKPTWWLVNLGLWRL